MSEVSEMEIEKHSCLLEEQHGYQVEEAVALSDEELEFALGLEEDFVFAAGVNRPRVHRVYQAKAATRRDRSLTEIDQLVIHAPEGYEGGTLAVLQQGRAGFDWFLPPSGNLYKCNAFASYVAWQAGYWPSNLRSIGIEQWDFAANMGNAPDAHYRRLAALLAWLAQLLEIPVRHANWDEPGLVAHAQITPNSRTDPGKDFDWNKLIRYTRELLADSANPKPLVPDTVFRVIAGAFSDTDGANTRAAEIRRAGFGPPWVYRHGEYWRVQAGSYTDPVAADTLVENLKAAGFEAYALAEPSDPKA